MRDARLSPWLHTYLCNFEPLHQSVCDLIAGILTVRHDDSPALQLSLVQLSLEVR